MKTRLIPLAVLALLVAGATITAFAVGGGGATAEDGELPIRSESSFDPDECIQVHVLTVCSDQGFDSPGPGTDAACEPVPLRSDCGIDPAECNMIHNIDACDDAVVPVESCIQVLDPTGPVAEPSCEPVPPPSDGGTVTDGCEFDACDDGQIVLDPPGAGPVIEPICEPLPPVTGGGIATGGCETLPPDEGEVLEPLDPAIEPSGYEMTVVFNASVTQEDLLDAEDILRGFDEDLEFLIQESFPPIGRAFLGTAGPDDCLVAASLLEAQSYVDSASCEAITDDGPVDDVPGTVVHPNAETN